MATTPLDIKSILDSVDAPREAKAAAWDAFHGASSPDDFRSRFDAIALPREAKAALWDTKFSTPAPGQTTPAASPQSPASAPANPASTGAGVMEPFRRIGAMILGTEKQPTALGAMVYPMTATDPTVRRDLNARTTLPIPGLGFDPGTPTPSLLDFSQLGASAAMPEGSAVRGATAGLEDLASGIAHPTNVILMGGMGLLKAAPTLQKMAHAGFSVQMLLDAYERYPRFQKAVQDGDMEGAAREFVGLSGSAAMGVAAARGAVVEKPRPVRVAPDTPAEAKASQAALATNEDLAIARVDPAQASKVVNQEIARRQAAGQWDATLEKTPSPEERRAAKKASRVEVPSEGDPDPVLTYQRGNVAAELAGKPYEQLGPEERSAVDDLVKQGFGMREAQQPPAGVDRLADTVPVVPEVDGVRAPGNDQGGTVPGMQSAYQGAAGAPEAKAIEPRQPTGAVVYGREADVRVPGERTRYKSVYAVREAEDVVPSHNPANFEANPDYQHVNDRNYSDPQNAERIVKQAAEFDPGFLVNDNPTAENGPPIIDANGNVLGGNSRTMTMARVREQRPEAMAEYRRQLETKAKAFGLDPEMVRRMKNPVLVRQVAETNFDPQRAITDFNKVGTAELKVAERAVADSRRIGQETLDHIQARIEEQGGEGTLAKALEGGDNRELLDRLQADGIITQGERPKLMNGDGSLTADGKGRVSRLLIGRLFEDARQLEDAAPDLKQRLERVVAPLARVAGKEGWDITQDVKDAVRLVEEARSRDVPVSDLVKQGGLFGDAGWSENAIALADVLKNEKPTEIARRFRQYANEADLGAGEQGMMFGDPPTPADSFLESFVGERKPSPIQQLVEKGAEASKRLQKRLSATSSANEFLNPETIRDMALSIAGDVARGLLTVENLGRELSKRYGPKARAIAQRVWNEAQNILKPIGADEYNEHGPAFKGFGRDEAGATAKLKELQSGDARGALFHRKIGPIDLIWGEAGDPAKEFEGGFGLAHILAKHPEMEGKLQRFLDSSDIEERRGNKIILSNESHTGAVKLEMKGREKKWLLTAYERGGTPTAEGVFSSRAPVSGAVAHPATEGVPASSVPSDRQLINRGAELVTDRTQKFSAWRAAMQEEFPDLKAGQAARLWGPAKRRATQRGSVTIGPIEPKAEAAGAAPPKKTATAEAPTPPADGAIPVSPSYEQTKGRILDKAGVSDEAKTALAAEMQKWEAVNPERKKITHAEIEANAKKADPSLLLDMDRKTAQETVIKDPALYHAARQLVVTLGDQAAQLNEQIRTATKDTDTLELERRRDIAERDMQQLLGVTLGVRSQHGRNLAMHRMMVDKAGFDDTYWAARAKKSLGLPADASLPTDVQRDLNGAMAEGRAAEAEALGKLREKDAKRKQAEAAGAPVPKRKAERDPAKQKPTPEAAKPDTTTPPTPEEKAAIDADAKVQEAKRKLARKMAKLEQTTLLEAISSIRRAGLLTSPRTHMRNFLGNASMQALEETSRVPGAMLDIGLSLFSGQRTYAGASGKAVARATAAAATRGVEEARQVMRQGATDEQLAQFDMPKEMNLGGGRVSRILETYTNTVFRLMSAADRVFKRYAIQRSLEEQMKLAKVDTPTEAMMAQAIADADFATFNNENKVATMYSRAKAGASPGVRFAMDMAVPFVRTPANVLARVLDYSGGGLVKAGVTGAQAALAKALTPEQQRSIAANFGRGVTGPALIYMGYQLAAAGLATGSYQADAGKRNSDEAAGRLNGAVKIGDTWQMVSPLSPGGALITIGATLQREATGPIRDEAKRPGKLAAVVGRTVLDHPFLQGAKDIADAVSSPAQQGERALAGMAGSFVPSIVSDAASLGDDVRRDARTDGGFVDAAAAAMAARTPGARNTLPERKDVLGRTQPQSPAAVINPGIGSQAKEDSDPIIREIIRNKVALSEPQRATNETLDQFRMRREILGREIEKQLGREITTPAYKRLDNEEERRATLDKAEKRARLLVAAKLGKRYAAADAATRQRMLTELLKAPR